MLTETDLIWMRSLATESMPDVCDVTSPSTTETRDAYGEITTGETTTQNDIKCGYAPATGRELIAGGQVAEAGDYVLRFPANTNVPANSTVVVAARGAALQRTFRVKAELHRSDEIHTRVLATEVSNA